MGWIVQDAIIRYRHEYGYYHWHQWRVCVRDIGYKFSWLAADDPTPGLVAGGTIYIRRGMDRYETARVAWHEIAHALLHAGSTHFWVRQPGGLIYVRRLESQADEFASCYPVWDDAAYESAFGRRKRTA